jgi:hypothetical protein
MEDRDDIHDGDDMGDDVDDGDGDEMQDELQAARPRRSTRNSMTAAGGTTPRREYAMRYYLRYVEMVSKARAAYKTETEKTEDEMSERKLNRLRENVRTFTITMREHARSAGVLPADESLDLEAMARRLSENEQPAGQDDCREDTSPRADSSRRRRNKRE